MQGLKAAWASEKSFRAQIIITLVVLLSLIFLRPSLWWSALFILVIGSTLAAELFNTALEYMLDVLHPEQHPEIGKAKDCAAAAVLVLSVASILIFLFFILSKCLN